MNATSLLPTCAVLNDLAFSDSAEYHAGAIVDRSLALSLLTARLRSHNVRMDW